MVLSRLFGFIFGLFSRKKEEETISNVPKMLEEKLELPERSIEVREYKNLIILRPSVSAIGGGQGHFVDEIVVFKLEKYEDARELAKLIRDDKVRIFIVDYEGLYKKGEEEVRRTFSLIKRFTDSRRYSLAGIGGIYGKIALIWPEDLRVVNYATRKIEEVREELSE